MDTARRLRLAVPIVVGVVLVDQLTKWWALEALDDGSRVEVLPTLEFELAFNSGFSFSTGSGNGRLIGLLVLGLSAVLLGVIARATSTMRANSRTCSAATLMPGRARSARACCCSGSPVTTGWCATAMSAETRPWPTSVRSNNATNC